MRILYFSQHFPPDIGAASNRCFNFSKELVKRGNQVTVITAFPHYPSGQIPEEYKNKFFSMEQKEGIKVIRSWIFARPNRNVFNRLLNYFSFMFSSFLSSIFKTKGKFDVLLITSPPLFLGISAYFSKFFKAKKLILDIRDIWPEAAIKAGLLKVGILINILKKIEEYLYSHSDVIITTSPAQTKKIKNKTNTNAITITNGFDKIENIKNYSDLPEKIKEKIKGRKIIIHPGNIGLVYDFETPLNAIKEFQDRYFILFIGDGPKRKNLESFVKKLKLTNVLFLNPISKKELNLYLANSDFGLIPYRQDQEAITAKFFDYLQFGITPIGCFSEGIISLNLDLNKNNFCTQNTLENWMKLFKNTKKQKLKNIDKFSLKYRVNDLEKYLCCFQLFKIF